MLLRAKIFILFLSPFVLTIAQSDSLKSVEFILNKYINSETVEKENSQLYDLIEFYLDNPIPLNNASKSDLMKLPFADIQNVSLVIAYREKNGEIFSYGELKSIKNISNNFIDLLKLFTYLKTENHFRKRFILDNYKLKTRSRISYDLQEKEGYKSGYYTGSPVKLYNRLKLNANSKVFFGALIEKDAGEESYYDFYSFYLQVKDILGGLQLLGGYYTMEFGQGLAIWSPYSFSKSSDATNSVIKRARGISPYSSAGEYLFLKGGAISYTHNYFTFSSFYALESNDYSNSSKNTFGFTLALQPIKNLKISALYYRKTDEILSNNLWVPSSTGNISLAYEANYKSIFFTGETAFYENNIATVNTLQISLRHSFLLVASLRNYSEYYKSPYSQGFGETSNTNNEFGLYFGFKWKTNFGIINFYLDQFKFPNSSTSIPLPSNGNELSFSYQYTPLPQTNIYFRYFNETKEIVEELDNKNIITDRKINKFRFELQYSVSKALKFKSRIEILSLSTINISENGILLFQDFRYTPNSKLSFLGRIIFFETDSFASRIYEFENDLIGVMTNQPLWGTGMKWYILLKYKPLNSLFISAKYSELYKPNDDFIGSGFNLINNNIDNKISLQIDLTF